MRWAPRLLAVALVPIPDLGVRYPETSADLISASRDRGLPVRAFIYRCSITQYECFQMRSYDLASVFGRSQIQTANAGQSIIRNFNGDLHTRLQNTIA